jgi:hypothetical protein
MNRLFPFWCSYLRPCQFPIVAVVAQQLTLGSLALASEPWFGVPLPDSSGLDPALIYEQRDFLAAMPGSETLPPEYADIDGSRLLAHVRDQVAISQRNRAEGDIVWGRVAGRSGDRMVTTYLREQFEAIGLSDIRVDTVAMPTQYWPVDVELTLLASDAAGDGTKDFQFTTAMPQPGSPATDGSGLTADFVYAGYGRDIDIAQADLTGNIAVIRGRPAQGAYNTARGVPDRLAEAGAVAVVVILDLPIDVQTYNRAVTGTAVPTMAIADHEGAFLESVMARAGDKPLQARMRIILEAQDTTTSNIIGRVDGTTDEYAVVIAHHDAYFDGAVDNASGVAAMLGLASHFAQLPEPPRRTHIFVATGGHHAGGFPGATAFAELHLPLREKTAIVLNAEHVAAVQAVQYTAMDEAEWGSTGGLLVSNAEIPRFGSVVPENPFLLGQLARNLAQQRVTMLANAWSLTPGDAIPFQQRGYAVAQIIEVSNWYHTTADTLGIVPEQGLARATRAFAGFLHDIDQLSMVEIKVPPGGENGRPESD